MASALGLLDSSARVPSCSLFRPASFQHGAVKAGGRSRTMKCSCSREEESGASFPGKKAFSALVATGLALAISTNSGIAAPNLPQPPGSFDNEIVKEKKDSLLKDADKPQEAKSLLGGILGKSRDNFTGGAEQISGGVEKLGGPGELGGVTSSNKGSDMKDKMGGGSQLANVKEKVGGDIYNAKGPSRGFIADAKSKAASEIEAAQDNNGMKDPAGKAKELVSDASSKAGSVAENLKNKVGGNMGNMDNGMKDPAGKAKELVSDARSKAGSAVENAKSSLGSAVDNAKSMVGSSNLSKMDTGTKDPARKAKELVSDTRTKVAENAKKTVESKMNNMDNGMKDPAGKAKELVSDARSKGGSAAENAKSNTNDLFGSIKKGLGIQ